MNKGKKISRARIGYVKSNHLNLILFSFMTKMLLAGKNSEGRYINEKLAYFLLSILKTKPYTEN
jgi:hypothetical protein